MIPAHSPMKPPLSNSYWVLPGRLLAGEHPFGEDPVAAQNRFASLREAGIDYFIDLTEVGERPNYHRLLHRQADYVRFPIADSEVPKEAQQMQRIQTSMREALARQRNIYVHCRAGIGRTGMVVGCYLADEGLGGKEALKQLNKLWRQSARAQSWPKVPQTAAQADYIWRWPELRPSS
jgi:hypothetical protein